VAREIEAIGMRVRSGQSQDRTTKGWSDFECRTVGELVPLGERGHAEPMYDVYAVLIPGFSK
jgi:hypothetical protein